MRLLFATTRSAGHFGPLLPVAHASVRAGHQVLVAGPPAAEPLARRAELPFRAVGEAPRDELDRVRARLRSASGEQALVVASRDLFVGCHARAALPAMVAAIEDWRPDLVVRETGEFSSCVAAERAGVAQARVGIALSAPDEDGYLEVVAPALDELRAELGLEPDPGAERARAAICLTQAPRSLDGPAAAAATVRRFRQPVEDLARRLPDWWGGREDPLVYLSFGSVAPTEGFYPDLYRAALDALAGLPVRVLVTIGEGQDPAELGERPPSVRVERWVPQAAVMPDAAAMVGHGGAGTTLMALAGGVPMALLPLFADQPMNARRVAEAGAGVVLEGGPAAIAGVEDAVRRLLDDPSYRDAAGAVSEEIRALPPVDEAIDALVAVVEDGAAA